MDATADAARTAQDRSRLRGRAAQHDAVRPGAVQGPATVPAPTQRRQQPTGSRQQPVRPQHMAERDARRPVQHRPLPPAPATRAAPVAAPPPTPPAPPAVAPESLALQQRGNAPAPSPAGAPLPASTFWSRFRAAPATERPFGNAAAATGELGAAPGISSPGTGAPWRPHEDPAVIWAVPYGVPIRSGDDARQAPRPSEPVPAATPLAVGAQGGEAAAGALSPGHVQQLPADHRAAPPETTEPRLAQQPAADASPAVQAEPAPRSDAGAPPMTAGAADSGTDLGEAPQARASARARKPRMKPQAVLRQQRRIAQQRWNKLQLRGGPGYPSKAHLQAVNEQILALLGQVSPTADEIEARKTLHARLQALFQSRWPGK